MFLGQDFRTTESALAYLSGYVHASKHTWGYSVPLFKSRTEQVYLGASFGSNSYSSFHMHPSWRQTVYSLEGEVVVQTLGGNICIVPTEFGMITEEDAASLVGDPSKPSDFLILFENTPHRLIFPKPCLFIETYSLDTTIYKETAGGYASFILEGSKEDAPDVPITRLTVGGESGYSPEEATDFAAYQRHVTGVKPELFCV